MKKNVKSKRLLSLLLFALLLFQQSTAMTFAEEVSGGVEANIQSAAEASETELDAEQQTEAEDPAETVAPAETEVSTEQSVKQDFTYEESGVQVDLHLTTPIDEAVTLSVEKIDADSFENEAFEAWLKDQLVFDASIYDIHLTDAEGNEVKTGEATVKMTFSDAVVQKAEGEETKLTFLHITDEGNVEEGKVNEDGTIAEITANGLSPFIFVRSSSQKDNIRTVDGTTTIDVASAEELNTAVETINNGTGDYTLNLTADITMASSLSITKNKVTIIGNGHSINFGGAEVAISVNSSTSDKPVLILGDAEDSSNKLTLNGDNVARDGGHLIAVAGTGSVAGNGTVKIYAGTTLQNAKSNNTFGGAIVVGQGGYLEMNGGTITNCGVEGGSVNFGGGVAVISGGSFTMNGGSISDCYAETDYDSGWQVPAGAGGAVFVGQGSTFTMNGGSLTDNRASTDGGAVAVIGSLDKVYDMGGYGYLDSRFEMNDGTISGNSAGYVGGGVAALGTYIEAYGLCSATAAAGRPENPGIYINGGSISSNHASEGGGVFLNWIRGSIPVQIHHAAICSNTAESGAGIEVMSYWTQADIDGCTIEGNISDEKGAGIYLKGNSSGSGTTLKNTSVKDNKSGAIGAGIYYDANSKLTISGKNIIQNNTYNGVINNLNILDDSHPVYVNGSLKGSSIGLSDPTLWNDNLSDSDSTALSTAKLTSGFKEYNEGLDPEDVFTSDHSTWAPDYGEKKEDTKRMDYSSTASTWSDIKVMDTVWVTPSMDTYSGLKTLYYNPKTEVYSIDSSSSYKVAMIEKEGTYYLAYKNGTNYYILKSLSGEPEYRTYSLGGRNMTYGHFPSDLSIDGYDYIRSNDFTTASTKSISCYELTEVSNGDGYDYTNEVRLVRAYDIKYMDGESEANFGTIKYPKTYKNEKVDLVNPEEKKNYVFAGWYRDSAFTDGPITSLGTSETLDKNNNIVLYGKWLLDISSDEIIVGDLENTVYNGKDQKLVPSIKTKAGVDLTSSDYTVTYSGDTKNVGTVTVTVTGTGNYTGTVTRTYDITKKELTVKTEDGEKVYDGKPLTAKGSIVGFVEGESAELNVRGTQTNVGSSENAYTIVWNDTTKESNYDVKETVGTLTVKASDAFNVGDLENTVYNGKDQKLVPSVKTKAGVDLTSSDYTVTYSGDTKNVGTVTVTVTGIGNYTGTVTKTYEITKKELTVKTENGEKVYDGKPLTAKGSIDGFVDGESAELNVTGTQINVGSSENAYTIVWNDNTKESNYDLKETVGTLTVKAQSIVEKPIITDDPKDANYDGKDHKFLPVVKSGDEVLVEGKDYTVTYSTDDFKNPGEITVTITGIGNYEGVITKTYKITKEDTKTENKSTSKTQTGGKSTTASTPKAGNTSTAVSTAKTGDTSNIMVWFAVLAAALAGIAGISGYLVVKKKRKN